MRIRLTEIVEWTVVVGNVPIAGEAFMQWIHVFANLTSVIYGNKYIFNE